MSANNFKPDINFIEEQIKALSPEDRAALLSRLALPSFFAALRWFLLAPPCRSMARRI